MTSRERVLRAARREETDRTPLDFSGWQSVVDRLIADLNLGTREDLLRSFQIDIRPVGIGAYSGPQRFTPDGEPADCWGHRGGGTYADSLGYRPLQSVTTVDEVYDYPWPNPDDFDYSTVESQCDACAEFATRGSSWAPIFCLACDLCGMETMLCFMAAEPEIAGAILERITDVYLGMNERMFKAANGKLDICFMGDDYGSQQGLLMSPECWRTLIKPNLARLYKHAREYGLVTMHHCCGSIPEIIPDLIEIGVEVLDPIQVRAAGMEPAVLKGRFGHALAFHGAVDTQRTLPFGSPDDVAEAVRYLIRTLGEGGGYILTGSQELIDDIPTPNILSMYRTALTALSF